VTLLPEEVTLTFLASTMAQRLKADLLSLTVVETTKSTWQIGV